MIQHQFYYVEALTNGVWRSQRQMVVALVQARWCIDGLPFETERGVVYSFSRDEDAEYFLTLHEGERNGEPRAVPVAPDKGQMVVFARAEDAQFFIDRGMARPMSDAEVQQVFMAAAGGAPADEPAALSPVVEQPDEVPPVHAPVEKKRRKASAAS